MSQLILYFHRYLLLETHSNSNSLTRFESVISSVSTNAPPSRRSHFTGTSTLVPATRPRSELKRKQDRHTSHSFQKFALVRPLPLVEEIALTLFLQIDTHHSSDTVNTRTRKRPRLETTSSDPEMLRPVGWELPLLSAVPFQQTRLDASPQE